MLPPHPDADILAARTAKLSEAYNARDVGAALTMFADESLDYSDYGLMALNMDKSAFKTFLESLFSTLLQLKVETVSLSGHKGFQAWEWEMRFLKKEGTSEWKDLDQGKEGQEMIMRGVSLSWWVEDVDGENSGWKIVKNCDYARFVEEILS